MKSRMITRRPKAEFGAIGRRLCCSANATLAARRSQFAALNFAALSFAALSKGLDSRDAPPIVHEGAALAGAVA